jgi:hypothetical protein
VKIIKRTKITVIRTETVFLKAQNVPNSENSSQFQITNLLEEIKQDSVFEIEAIKQIENTEIRKEK